jgi:hypothetical protein
MYKISKIKKESETIDFGESMIGFTGQSGSQLALLNNSKNKKPIRKKKIYQLGRFIPDARKGSN